MQADAVIIFSPSVWDPAGEFFAGICIKGPEGVVYDPIPVKRDDPFAQQLRARVEHVVKTFGFAS